MAAEMEMFGLSRRELEKKFTKSEMAILAWRSQEISYSMEQQTKETNSGGTRSGKTVLGGQLPEGLPDHFFNSDGEVDLRQVTGKEAYEFFQKMGVYLPVIQK